MISVMFSVSKNECDPSCKVNGLSQMLYLAGKSDFGTDRNSYDYELIDIGGLSTDKNFFYGVVSRSSHNRWLMASVEESIQLDGMYNVIMTLSTQGPEDQRNALDWLISSGKQFAIRAVNSLYGTI